METNTQLKTQHRIFDFRMRALKSLYLVGQVVLIGDEQRTNGEELTENHEGVLAAFLQSMSIRSEINETINQETHTLVASILNKHLEMGTVKKKILNCSFKEEKKGLFDSYSGEVITYVITSKGLDACLKLQEHEDNERRFEQQTGISEIIKKNSSESVKTSQKALKVSYYISCLALLGIVLSFLRLDALQEKVVSLDNLESRILHMESKPKELIKENKLLEAELLTLKAQLKEKKLIKPKIKKNTNSDEKIAFSIKNIKVNKKDLVGK
jgi:hypothetical protein